MAEEFVEVYVTYDSIEAGMLKDMLESGGIAVVLRSAKVSPYPVNIGRMGEIRLLVRRSDENAALQLVQELGREQD